MSVLTRILTRSSYVLLAACLAASIFAALWLFTTPYSVWTHQILEKIGKLQQIKEFEENFMPLKKFYFLRAAMFSCVVFLAGAFALLLRFQEKVSVFFEKTTGILSGFFRATLEVFGALGQKEKIACLLAITLLLLWRIKLLFFIPLNYDEAYSFLNFSSRGPLVAATYYKAPNNHIFFSILSSLFVQLPLGPTLAIRLPAFLASGLASCLLFVLIGKLASPRAGLATATLFSFSIPITLYAILGRGYSFVILFFLAGLHAAFKIIRGGSAFYWVFLSAACILGMFTTPVFADPAALFYLFILWQLLSQKKRPWKEMVLSGTAVALLTAMCYIPALVVSGVTAFMHPSVLPDNRQEVIQAMPVYLADMFDWLTGSRRPFGLLAAGFAVPALGWLAFKKTGGIKLFAQCALLFLASPPFFAVVHAVQAYFRIWIYLIIFLAASLPLFFFHGGGREKSAAHPFPFANSLVTILCIFTAAFGMIRFDTWHREHFLTDCRVGGYIRSLTGRPLQSIYTDYDHFDVLFRYQNRKNRFRMNSGTLPFDENQNYDLVVLKKPLFLPGSLLERHYQLHFDDPSFQALISKAAEK